MRIVGGSRRGRKLKVPPGRDLRPTADRVREAVFNLLEHRDFGAAPLSGSRVVEFFAGTGALGLEALSRGASYLTAIENEATAFAVLEENIEALDFEDRAVAVRADALRPPPPQLPSDYAFLDPPYRSGLGTPALSALARDGWLAPAAVIVLELADKEVFEPPPEFTLLDERHYGAARIVFLRYNPPSSPEWGK